MRNEEVTQPLVLVAREAVVLRRQHRIETAVREEIDEPRGRVLDELNPGRLERLEEARGEPHRDTVAAPGLAAHPGGELEQPRLAQGSSLEAAEELCPGFVVRHQPAAIDVSVADTMLQRNPPLPPCSAGGRYRIWREITGPLACDRHCPITGQPPGPVVIACP